jgi:hypothetical protein
MPPTGTRHSPVPLPIRWYRKHRFWIRDSSWRDANVPMTESVATTPRTVSSVKRRSIVSPRGRSMSSSQSAESTDERSAAADCSGSSSVGAMAAAREPTAP